MPLKALKKEEEDNKIFKKSIRIKSNDAQNDNVVFDGKEGESAYNFTSSRLEL